MNPTSIVTSLKWAKKLRDAGYPQKSCLHYWANGNPDWAEESYYVDTRSQFLIIKHDKAIIKITKKEWAAPTAEEILRRLPDTIRGEKSMVPLLVSFRAWSSKGFNIRYAHGLQIGDEQACVVSGDTLANAAAAMYFYLAEEKLLPKPSPNNL